MSRIKQLYRWLRHDIGFRKHAGKAELHDRMRKTSASFFEFLKRAAIVSAIYAASRHAVWLVPLYIGGLVALAIPIGTWVEQWDVYFRRRTKSRDVASAGAGEAKQVENEDGWYHAHHVTLLISTLVGWGIHWVIHTFVSNFSAALSQSSH